MEEARTIGFGGMGFRTGNESPTSCLAVFGVRFALADDAYGAEGASPIVGLLVDHVPVAVGAEAATSLPDAQLDLRSLLPARTRGGWLRVA